MNRLIAAVLLLAPPAVTAQERTPPHVVADVDFRRYAGTWYEIARYPNRFQESCAGDVTATYRLLEDGELEVVNRCRNADGTFREARGRARKQSPDGPDAMLEVRFAPAFLSFLPFVWGEYWIIELAGDYSSVVIGGASREYLWILARSPSVDPSTYDRLLGAAAKQGYDPSLLVKTVHTP